MTRRCAGGTTRGGLDAPTSRTNPRASSYDVCPRAAERASSNSPRLRRWCARTATTPRAPLGLTHPPPQPWPRFRFGEDPYGPRSHLSCRSNNARRVECSCYAGSLRITDLSESARKPRTARVDSRRLSRVCVLGVSAPRACAVVGSRRDARPVVGIQRGLSRA